MLISTKSLIKHKLLNILTILNFSMEEISILEDKNKIHELIKLAILLVEYENIFLDEKLKFFIQEQNISEILEIIILTYEEEITAKKVKISPLKSSHLINIDRYYFIEALNRVFLRILDIDKISYIKFKFKKESNSLSLFHDGRKIEDFNKNPLVDYLEREDAQYTEIHFQIALHILDSHGIKIFSRKGEIEIFFPSLMIN